jgi:hypothetical protein
MMNSTVVHNERLTLGLCIPSFFCDRDADDLLSAFEASMRLLHAYSPAVMTVTAACSNAIKVNT